MRECCAGLALVPELPVDVSLIGAHSKSQKDQVECFIDSHMHQLHLLEPMPENELLEVLGQHEIGLALELGTPKNRDICRTNKLFTYPLAGCYMMVSETAAQRQFLEEFPETGYLIDLRKPRTIADALKKAHAERAALHQKRQATWQLAHDRLHWKKESEVLVELVKEVMQ